MVSLLFFQLTAMVMIGNIAIFVLLIGLGQASSPENDRDNMAKVRNMMNQLANLEKLYRGRYSHLINPEPSTICDHTHFSD